MEKSWFLHLAYQARAGGATDHDCLDVAKAEVQRLHGELEESQWTKELLHREVWAQSQIKALTSQMASLKDELVVQEIELTLVGAARNKAK